MRPTTRMLTLMIAVILGIPSLVPAQPYPPTYMGGFRWAGPEADLRIAVKPREASVYVDGYYAGKVDDFDGVFQRLHITPGEHEIVIYLEGHRSLRQQLYLAMNRTHRMEGILEPLASGQANEPLPVPVPRQERAGDPDAPQMPQRRPLPRAPMGRTGPAQPMPPAGSDRPANDGRPLPPVDTRFGTLLVSVQPSGSTIVIGDETWDGPSDDDQVVVQLTEGRHRVEVRKEGYETFTTDVEVQRGRTQPLTVRLRER